MYGSKFLRPKTGNLVPKRCSWTRLEVVLLPTSHLQLRVLGWIWQTWRMWSPSRTVSLHKTTVSWSQVMHPENSLVDLVWDDCYLGKRIDVLMNNAGVMAIPERQETKDPKKMEKKTCRFSNRQSQNNHSCLASKAKYHFIVWTWAAPVFLGRFLPLKTVPDCRRQSPILAADFS